MREILITTIIAACFLIPLTGCISDGVDPAFSYILNKRLTALENKTNTVVMYELSGADLQLLLKHLKDEEEKHFSMLMAKETKTFWVRFGISELPITLTKTDKGWVGPKDEVYKGLPSKAQVQSIYGR